jgi:hypothetical protein
VVCVDVCFFAAFRERVSHPYGQLARNALYFVDRSPFQLTLRYIMEDNFRCPFHVLRTHSVSSYCSTFRGYGGTVLPVRSVL